MRAFDRVVERVVRGDEVRPLRVAADIRHLHRVEVDELDERRVEREVGVERHDVGAAGALHAVGVTVRDPVDAGIARQARAIGERGLQWPERLAEVDDLLLGRQLARCGTRAAGARRSPRAARRASPASSGAAKSKPCTSAPSGASSGVMVKVTAPPAASGSGAGLPRAAFAGRPAGSRRPTSTGRPNGRGAAGTRRGRACRRGRG